MTPNRARWTSFLLSSALLLVACGDTQTGPVRVAAIGEPPQIVNPNRMPLDPPSAFLLDAVAQGLVRLDAAGEIEPALAQSWIVSDDGLRYTFRLQRNARWADGTRVTAEQVAARLQAALSRASRNPLKPVLAVVDEVVAMTDEVLELSLVAPRPHLLQLLAQPEMAILRGELGTGPYRSEAATDGALRLVMSPPEDEDSDPAKLPPPVLLRGERTAQAVARFAAGETDLVIGGTVGGLPLVRSANLPGERLAFDPVGGLFGLAFAHREGVFDDPRFRRALDMAIDRGGLVTAIGVPGLQPRAAIISPGLDGLQVTAQPDWADQPLPMRRAQAQATIDELGEAVPSTLRVSMPSDPGYRAVFAHLRRDWRAIGLEVEHVAPGTRADLVLVDEVAPAVLPSWYLRHFTCQASIICSAVADEALASARQATDPAERRAAWARADEALEAVNPFIALAAPVRWSLVSPRVTGFRPNPFALHGASELIAADR